MMGNFKKYMLWKLQHLGALVTGDAVDILGVPRGRRDGTARWVAIAEQRERSVKIKLKIKKICSEN